MATNLPGYYFDPGKNRYFKIQANHVAPTGSRYSRQAVKAEKVIQRTQRQEETVQQSKVATTVTRSKLLQHPLLSLDRRLGDLRKSVRASVAGYYAVSLKQRDVLASSAVGQPRLLPESGCFAVDHGSGTLFADFTWRNAANLSSHRASELFAFHRNDNPFHEEPHVRADVEAAGPLSAWRSSPQQDQGGVLYSMDSYEAITRVARVEAIASIGNGLVIWTQSSRPDQLRQESRVRVSACRTGLFSDRSDIVHESAFYKRIQDIAVQPGISAATGQPSYMVVLATGNPLWLMDTSTWRYPVAEYPLQQQDGTNDVMKIHFKDRNIVMAGTRSGKMLLLDIREAPGANSNKARIQHSSAITNLRALPGGNGTSILIAGLGSHNSTKTYDLRYTPSPSLKCHLPRANSYRESPSIMTFSIPETRRQDQYGLGWAYDEELNLMVHASTDYVRNHRVGLWDCSTGRLVSSPLKEFVFEGPVTCADVARVRDGPKSILLGRAGACITEWTNQGLGRLKKGRDEDG